MYRLERVALWSIIIAFAIGFYFYPVMPDTVVSHWNYRGEPDAYLPKFWGLFLIPLLMTLLYMVFTYIPRFQHARSKDIDYQKYYRAFFYILLIFLFYVYMVSVVWNSGFRFMIGQVLAPAFAVLYYVIGDLLSHIGPNYVMGIRTPWTLKSPAVWASVHHKAGALFRFAGFFALMGIFSREYVFLLILVPVIVSSLYLIWFSYHEYERLES